MEAATDLLARPAYAGKTLVLSSSAPAARIPDHPPPALRDRRHECGWSATEDRTSNKGGGPSEQHNKKRRNQISEKRELNPVQRRKAESYRFTLAKTIRPKQG